MKKEGSEVMERLNEKEPEIKSKQLTTKNSDTLFNILLLLYGIGLYVSMFFLFGSFNSLSFQQFDNFFVDHMFISLLLGLVSFLLWSFHMLFFWCFSGLAIKKVAVRILILAVILTPLYFFVSVLIFPFVLGGSLGTFLIGTYAFVLIWFMLMVIVWLSLLPLSLYGLGNLRALKQAESLSKKYFIILTILVFLPFVNIVGLLITWLLVKWLEVKESN